MGILADVRRLKPQDYVFEALSVTAVPAEHYRNNLILRISLNTKINCPNLFDIKIFMSNVHQ